jgi:hypothetical protein
MNPNAVFDFALSEVMEMRGPGGKLLQNLGNVAG